MVALKLITIGMLVAVLAAQDAPKPVAYTISENSFLREDGYNFAFKTSDGVSRQEEAELINVGDHKGIGVKGSYSYLSPDGNQYLVSFTADEKGYRPTISIVPPQGSQ